MNRKTKIVTGFLIVANYIAAVANIVLFVLLPNPFSPLIGLFNCVMGSWVLHDIIK